MLSQEAPTPSVASVLISLPGGADGQYDRVVKAALLILVGGVLIACIAGASAWSRADYSAAAASSTARAHTRGVHDGTMSAHLRGRTVTATLSELRHTRPWNTLPATEAAGRRQLRREVGTTSSAPPAPEEGSPVAVTRGAAANGAASAWW